MSYKSSISSQNIEDILKKIDGAIALDSAILSLTSSSTSTTISNAVGGSSGFTEILNSLRGGEITFGIIKDDSAGKGFIQANMYAHPTQNKLTVSWLDSLTPKQVEIERIGDTFSISVEPELYLVVDQIPQTNSFYLKNGERRNLIVEIRYQNKIRKYILYLMGANTSAWVYDPIDFSNTGEATEIISISLRTMAEPGGYTNEVQITNTKL